MHYILDDKIDSSETKLQKIRTISNKIKTYFTEKYHIYKIVLQPEFTKEDVELDSEKCYLAININNENDIHKSQCHNHEH
jgi:hypothetical protein